MTVRGKGARFVTASLLGLSFFVVPIPWEARFTVPFDLIVQRIIQTAPRTVAIYCLLLIVAGAVASLMAAVSSDRLPPLLLGYQTAPFLMLLRLAGVPLALLYFFRMGPEMLQRPAVAELMWSTLALSVGVIVPLGAAGLVFLLRYGLLEFVGTLMRPIMRPLFRLPGRSALDSLTSWVGSYSVGLYLTSQLVREGLYSRREAYTIITCFSTVSIGFVAVVAQTLGLLHLFPLLFVVYFAAVYLLTAILTRLWPITRVPETYLATPQPETEQPHECGVLLRLAWTRALQQAEEARGLPRMLLAGLLDGLVLASTILGSILTVGTAALLLARETPVFTWLGAPVVPLLDWLGLPDARIIAPATLVGITEMFIPALLVQEAAMPARFFIAVLSISQLIFFSAVGPMMIDMFRAIPIRARDLVLLFLMRTAILLPFLAAVTALLDRMGVFGR